MCRYLLAFNGLMSGDLEEPRHLLGALRSSDEPDMQAMVSAVAGMLARADALQGARALDRQDLTGWHMVVNGAVLLHESPFGFDEGMSGRYAYVSDNYGLIREGIERLRIVLESAGRTPERVLAGPDRSSQIVAEAVSQVLSLPLEPWAAEASGLVVVYDLDQVGEIEILRGLEAHRAGQVLWAHASSWTNPFPYAADITTMLYQACFSPWSGDGMQINPETGEAEPRPVDEAPVEEIAARIVAAEVSDSSHSSDDGLRAMVAAIATLEEECAAGLFRTTGRRTLQRSGSPVKSSRFY
ncbi:MAG: hypothetical protein AAFX94_13840 [Myxococcota bacterium]